MSIRSFFKSLSVLIAVAWNTKRQPELKQVQVFPTSLEELPGLLVTHQKTSPGRFFEIVRMYDEKRDSLEGQKVSNLRCNKWWSRDENGKAVLICLDPKFNDTRYSFYKKN